MEENGFLVTRGIVLRETQAKEADRILTVLTESEGKITIIAKGANSKKSRYAAAGQRERIWRACLAVFLPMLAWGILAVFHHTYAGIIVSIIIIDMGMQCIQLSNQSATMKLYPEASSRMNTIYMVTYFIGGSLGTFLAGTCWSLYGWMGTVALGFLMLVFSVLSTLIMGRMITAKTK